jgi:hypothetical protein
MPESEDYRYFVVVPEIGPTCLEHAHRLDPLPDHVLCLDRSQVESTSRGT